MKSKSNYALELAKKIREKLSNEQITMPSLLQECKTVCRYLGISDKHQWIDFELKGYSAMKLKNLKEEQKKLPEYRQVYQVFYDAYGHSVLMDNFFSTTVGKIPLNNPLAEIMEYTENGMIVSSSPVIDLLNSEKFRTDYNIPLHSSPIHHAKVSSSNIARIINGVKTKIYEFLDNIILELEYGQIPESIFEEIRQEVDEKLTKFCPNAIEKLPIVYEQLSNNNSVVFSQIASTCRQIIKDVADALYPPQKNSLRKNNKNIRLDESKTINRILTRIQNDSEQSVFKSMFEYVDNFLHSIQDYASKGDHSKFKKSDATRCVVYTYILLGDILHYHINNKKQNKKRSSFKK